MATPGPKSYRRSATVGERFRALRQGSSVVPQIRLAGHWLADAGFNVGDRLIVEVAHQELSITRMSEPEHTFG
jgi:hypothetical protein